MTKKISQIIIILAIIAAILVPAFTLFDVGDYLYCSINTAENKKLIIETIILALMIGATQYFVKSRNKRIVILAIISIVFSYLHSMLLPVVLAGVYFLAAISFGGIVTGSAIVIIVESALSLFNQGTPKKLGVAVLALAAIHMAYRLLVKKERPFELFLSNKEKHNEVISNNKENSCGFTCNSATTKWQLITNAIVLLVVLVQIGRASLAVADFDSLWYGLRSEHVLAPSGSIFEDLGLVGMVYTYSKGYEVITLPFSPLRSYAYIPVFNTCLFLIGLLQTYKIVGQLRNKVLRSQSSGYNVDTRACSKDIDERASNCAHASRVDFACLAVIITAVVPGIVNMCVSAKPDMITWVLQLVMIEKFFEFVNAERKTPARTILFVQVLAAYLVSLCMKPTAIIFSTALAGMMLIWWIVDAIIASRKSSYVKKKDFEEISIEEISLEEIEQGADCFDTKPVVEDTEAEVIEVIKTVAAAISLLMVWIRTIKLTGVPFTSVFSGILSSLGFSLKYPFATSTVPQYFQNESAVVAAAKRAARILLLPEGEDMNHVIIAWGGSIMLVLGVVIIICLVWVIFGPNRPGLRGPKNGPDRPGLTGPLSLAAALVFIPFAIVCAVTLGMLIQVDGNYYMTLYSIVIITAMWLCDAVVESDGRAMQSGDAIVDSKGNVMQLDNDVADTHSNDAITIILAISTGAMLLFQFFIMCITNWASIPGFTPITINKGYYDNEANNRIAMTAQASPADIASGNTIYDILAAQPQARVVSVALHPQYIQFKCVAQSYNDITRPWGNRALEESTDAFVEYLHFAKVDYIFADTEFLSHEEYSWRATILEEMKERGLLYDFIYEGNTYLARVK